MTHLFSIVLIELKGVWHTPLLTFLVTLLFARIPMPINALSCERNSNALGGFGLAH
jgi:hypothetical protein